MITDEVHVRWLERQYAALCEYPLHLRPKVLEDDSTPMSKGGRGIYSADEAEWMRARLAASTVTPEGDEVAIPDDEALGIGEGAGSCSICHVWPGHDIPAHVEALKAEILKDIDEGVVPPAVRTFSELHDTTDANMYEALGGSIEAGGETEEEQQANADTFNLITDEVNAWLVAGRSDAPLTPLLRAKALRAYLTNHYLSVEAHVVTSPEVSVLVKDRYGQSFFHVYPTPSGWDSSSARPLRHGDPDRYPDARPVERDDVASAAHAALRPHMALRRYLPIDR